MEVLLQDVWRSKMANQDQGPDKIKQAKSSLFVCLTGRSVRIHAWVLMDPDLNKMLKLGYKTYICMLAEWSMKIERKKKKN